MATLCVSGLAIIKAGANVSTSVPDAAWDTWIEEAEALIFARTRYDWVTNFGTINALFKPFLQEICSDLAAIQGISYDMSGYTTRGEAEDMMTVLRDAAIRGISFLKDQKVVTKGKL